MLGISGTSSRSFVSGRQVSYCRSFLLQLVFLLHYSGDYHLGAFRSDVKFRSRGVDGGEHGVGQRMPRVVSAPFQHAEENLAVHPVALRQRVDFGVDAAQHPRDNLARPLFADPEPTAGTSRGHGVKIVHSHAAGRDNQLSECLQQLAVARCHKVGCRAWSFHESAVSVIINDAKVARCTAINRHR